MSFAADGSATIFVDLGSRRVQSDDKIISWSVGAKPPVGVKFRPAPGTNCAFAAKGDGFYVVKGLAVFIR